MYIVSHYQARVSHRGLVVLETVVNLLASFPLTHHIHDLNSPPPPPPPPLHHPLPLHDNEGLIQEYWYPYREDPNVCMTFHGEFWGDECALPCLPRLPPITHLSGHAAFKESPTPHPPSTTIIASMSFDSTF